MAVISANRYQVIVGNIGTVYAGPSKRKANAAFKEYVELSRQNYGRAAGESVTYFDDEEVIDEYYGTNQEN